MTPEEKKLIIHDLCDNVKRSILEKVDRMPEEWNGIELRQLLADRFKDAVCEMKGKRLKDYRNAVIVNNL